MHETSAQGWCTGKTQRDGIGREAGGGIGMGNTCKSMAESCQCMAKTTTIFYESMNLMPETNLSHLYLKYHLTSWFLEH